MRKYSVHLICLALLAAITTAAYSNTFKNSFVFDDFPNIINVKSIRLFQPDIQGIINAAIDGPNNRRWLPNVSFALNYYFGKENVWGYHLVNLLIHIGNASALYFLFLSTLRLSLFNEKIFQKKEIAFIAALLWAVHPLQTNGVTYLVQRMTGMGTFFYITSLLCYVQGRLIPCLTTKRLLFFGLSLLFGLMAIASKENTLMLPCMILGYELFFFQTKGWSKNYKTIVLWGAATVTSMLIITFIFLGRDIFSTLLEGYNYRTFTLTERLLTQPRIIFFYLSLLAFPHPSRLNLNHDFSLSHSLLSPPETLFALLGIFLLAASIFFFYNRNRLFSFALFWFFGNLVIESSIIPLELIFEHRLYLPSIFLLLSLTCFAYQFILSKPLPARILLIIIIALCITWTWQRNQVWLNTKTLWSDVITKSPGLARGYNNLGVALHEERKLRDAEKLFIKAIQIEPESRVAYISLASLYITQNRFDEAEKILRTALTKETGLNPSRIYHYLGVLYRKLDDCKEAIRYADISLKLDKNDSESMITIGICYEKLGEYRKADATFRDAETSGLDYNVDLYNNWGIAVNKTGQVDRAIRYFKKALKIDPDHAESHYNLGVALSAKGLLEEARTEMRRAMELQGQ